MDVLWAWSLIRNIQCNTEGQRMNLTPLTHIFILLRAVGMMVLETTDGCGNRLPTPTKVRPGRILTVSHSQDHSPPFCCCWRALFVSQKQAVKGVSQPLTWRRLGQRPGSLWHPAGVPSPGTGRRPVRDWAAQQEVRARWASEVSSLFTVALPRLYYHIITM